MNNRIFSKPGCYKSYGILKHKDLFRMINYRAFITVLLIVLTQFIYREGLAQVRVTSLELYSNGQPSYSFPLVYAKSKTATEKINMCLQSFILNNERVITDANIVFTNSRYIGYINEDSTGQSGYTGISYITELNTPNVLSLSFFIESMGAYPENYHQYFNLNGNTGDIITAKDLFTSKGIEEIKQLLLRERKKRITEWINEMDTIYNDRNDSVWIRERLADCNKDAGEDDFIIKKGHIIFWKEYCFPHVARPYDTDLDVTFSYKRLTKFLSIKGKKLLQLR